MIVFCLVVTAIWGISLTAKAAKPAPAESRASKKPPAAAVMQYEVKKGDSLGAIAANHGVSLSDLISVNEIDNPDTIAAGSTIKIPGDPKNGILTKRGVKLRIPKGITLSRIAELYGTSVKRIARANKIKNPDKVRSGMRILIPGAVKVVELVPPPPCYKDPVEIYRVRSGDTVNVPLCFCNGAPNPEAIEKISAISGPMKKKAPFPLHPRLMQLLQRVSEEYPGKRIEIISGQRVRKNPGHESYHNKGQALDFRVAGVSNKTLSRFVRKLDRVGVGYYPNSVFIHMDTREKKAYWVDYSRPGEKAIYGRSNMTVAEVEAIRTRRKGPASKVASTPGTDGELNENTPEETASEIDTDDLVAKVMEKIAAR